jgi:hypothetical protein
VTSHVIVALTPHEARLLVVAIDDSIGAARWGSEELRNLNSVREDVMDGLASLAKSRPTTCGDGDVGVDSTP